MLSLSKYEAASPFDKLRVRTTRKKAAGNPNGLLLEGHRRLAIQTE
jgi:hypothetical protein